ncbi:MAG: hypothetical protein MNPFHGCM_02807 [Gemmatimonadaceae bacterium]|nr:hypothetical protein [Gemmatimonadaceae bacterium]
MRGFLGETALLAAVAHSHNLAGSGGPPRQLAVVKQLLDAGAATDGPDGAGAALFMAALHFAG